MSVVGFLNAKGQIRYQPEHPDGRREWNGESRWLKPFVEPNRNDKAVALTDMAPPWVTPALYSSKRRAIRQVSRLIAAENRAAHERFKEIK